MVDANRRPTLLTWGAGRQGVWNLNTGQFQIVIRHLSWVINHPDASVPIGGLLDGYPIARKGTFVCDAVGRNGGPLSVAMGPFYLDGADSAN